MLTQLLLRFIDRIEQRYGAEIAAGAMSILLAIFRTEARIKLDEEDKEGALARRAKALDYLADEQRRADGEVPPA